MDYDIVSNGTLDAARAKAQQRQPEPSAAFPRRMDLSTCDRILRVLRADNRREWDYARLAAEVDAHERTVRAAVSRLVEDKQMTLRHAVKEGSHASYARVQAVQVKERA